MAKLPNSTRCGLCAQLSGCLGCVGHSCADLCSGRVCVRAWVGLGRFSVLRHCCGRSWLCAINSRAPKEKSSERRLRVKRFGV